MPPDFSHPIPAIAGKRGKTFHFAVTALPHSAALTRTEATFALGTSPEKAIALGCRSGYSPRWFCDRNNVRPQPTPQGRVSSPHPESEDVSRWHLNPDSDGCTLALVLRRRVQTRYLLASSVSRRGVGSQEPSSTTMISFPAEEPPPAPSARSQQSRSLRSRQK